MPDVGRQGVQRPIDGPVVVAGQVGGQEFLQLGAQLEAGGVIAPEYCAPGRAPLPATA